MVKPGLLVSAEPGERKAAVEVAQELERMGFPRVLCPYDYAVPEGDWISGISEIYDSMSLATAILQVTNEIEVGTAITLTYTRHPADLAGAASFNHEISDGRFILGLGTSHDGILERFGIEPEKPVTHMRRYIERLHEASPDQPMPPIHIAALRQRMTKLATEVADGAINGNLPLSYVPELLKVIPDSVRDTFVFANAAPMYINEDYDEGLAFLRRFIGLHMNLPNYTGFFTDAGYGEEVEQAQVAVKAGDQRAVEAAVSERMAADIGIFGTRSQINEKVEAWQDAGVTLTVSTLYTSKDQPKATMQAASLLL